MYWYTIGQTLTQQERQPAPEQPAVVLLSSDELSHQPALPGLERTLHHTPPARDARVFSDPTSKTIQAIVDEDQLSLAIGRNGQNVRLASELTGWKIDLYSSREWLEKAGDSPLFAPLPGEEEAPDVPLAELGLSEATVAVLEGGGYRTLNDIIDLEREDFLRLPGIAPAEADRIFSMLMGDQVEPRREFIEENARVATLDV